MPDRTIGDDVATETVRIRGHEGDEVPAYLAVPPGPCLLYTSDAADE